MNLKKAFGKTLKEIREAKDISQENLAFEADLDRTYISLLERGLRQPSLETIFSLAKALSIRPTELVSKTEQLIHRKP